VPRDTLKIVQDMYDGKVNGCITHGENILLGVPHKHKVLEGLSKLKWLVVADPLDIETARFWEHHGELNNADPSAIQTEVFQLPTASFAENEGTFTNSGRTILWLDKAAEPPGEARTDIQILAGLFRRLRSKYLSEGGGFPDPIVSLTWNYANPDSPSSDELLKEINGYALEDLPDPADPTKVLLKAGQQLASFGQMTDDGKTAGGNWIYTGVYTEAGNMAKRRDNSDPTGKGVYGNWGFAWPANRRILYNRASADAKGRPWSARKTYMQWNGSRWAGPDVPDYGPTVAPDKGVGAFIMNPEGVARLFVRGMMKDGPFPEHYEPYESPVANVLHEKVGPTPTARVFDDVWDSFGTAEEFPYAATTYRLTEHFHYWSKHQHINAVLQPELFVELPSALAEEKGIKNGDWVQVTSKRGYIKAKAVVTKRMASLNVDGKQVHVVGIPIHWGFKGATKNGYGVNEITPFVADVNASTPEYKAFLVNVEPTTAPEDIPVASVDAERTQG
jgi:formate dehydrogenase major subunit